MIALEEIRKLAKSRLREATILFDNESYDGAIYLCGYAIELGFKAVICKNLNLNGKVSISHLPSTRKEFDTIESLLTHKLDALASLLPSNVIKSLRTRYIAEWNIVQQWNPEMRYGPVRQASRTVKNETKAIIAATGRILNYLSRQS